ncbi:SGNH/GDSL hydrolase family protein [Nocardioides sp. zg-1228]|uniref:SGNH/GDSL hydrolase family protein n=1 Tax=Nocardioides sp. zg-1228 TaxID=2763008 RepID=UPI00164347A1|nr:SGNH/GDSL hydrolase family protein [Nocardioides sp. zg-1228]MBC2932475.1 SGNH/GDSL hydrolase family protein [Nocardioides sp. zg-1228]QSF57982.1 SGNH/GDSL hydrolase family protein [Nocardioides sp. zg-1228]
MASRQRGLATALTTLLALLVALVVPLATATAPAGSAPPSRTTYDVLGDSYGSGYGVPPYGACGRSQSAYGVLVDGRARLDLDDFVACAGTTTTSLVAGGQLDALDADSDLVLLSIGGNDIGWSSAVVACLGGSDAGCAGALAVVRGRVVTQLPALLDSLYDRIEAAAPGARVIVTGYPRLFSPEHGAYLGASPAEQEALNEGADLLHSVIAAAARRHGFDVVDVRSHFVGHGVNAPDPWILGPADPGAFHPTLAGYEAYAGAVTAAIKPGRHR